MDSALEQNSFFLSEIFAAPKKGAEAVFMLI